METVFKFDFLKEKARKKIKKYLEKTVGSHSRKELLLIGALLHDIAKTDLLVKESTGFTNCPGHEIIGSLMVEKFSSRFTLDKKAEDFVKRIVCFHGFVNNILTLVIKRKNIVKYFGFFKQAVGDIYLELLLLMYADILGSDLKKLLPQEYQLRIKTIVKLLNKSLV